MIKILKVFGTLPLLGAFLLGAYVATSRVCMVTGQGVDRLSGRYCSVSETHQYFNSESAVFPLIAIIIAVSVWLWVVISVVKSRL